ncbi:MAG: glycosyltransferase family 39 protein [Ktedonobacteraceae bacterium]
MMKRLSPYLPAASIFCLALIVRVVYNLTTGRGYTPLYDSFVYQEIALNLLRTRCFCQVANAPLTGRAPLWPAVIAVIYDLLGPKNIYVRLFLSCVGSGTCVLVYLFARDLFGRRIGLVAGIIAVIYPNLFIYDGWLYSESLYTFLLFAFCYTLFLVQRTSLARWMLISGILAGLVSLTRPNGVIMPVIVIAWAIVIAWKKVVSWRVAASAAVIVAGLTLALVGPWTLRNYSIAHQFIPVATGDGTVLLGAYNHFILDPGPYQYLWIRPTLTNPQLAQAYLGRNCQSYCETQRDAAYKAAASQWINGHLSGMPLLLAMHVVKLWTPATPEGDLPMNQFPTRLSSRAVVALINILSYPLFILAAFGLLATRRKWHELLFIYGLIALTFAECIYYYGSSRFRAPIEPMLVLLAAGAIWWLVEKDNGTLRWLLNERKRRGGETTDNREQQPISENNTVMS